MAAQLLTAKSYPTLLRPNGLYVGHQAPLSMGFPRQDYWSGLSFPSLSNLPHPGSQPESSALAGRFLTPEPPGKPMCTLLIFFFNDPSSKLRVLAG